jgi:hypothetical protein
MLKQEIIFKIRHSREAITRLMLVHNKSERTIMNWLASNDPKLTTINSLSAISIALQIPVNMLTADNSPLS